jgi:vacuolar-type H+-ATPase subunit H
MAIENPRSNNSPLAHLPPLDQIRQTEAEVTRELVQARQTAGKIVQDAQNQAALVLQEARIAGENEGRTRYKEVLKKSEDEAAAMVAGARQQADGLRKTGKIHMESLVGRIVKFITGMEEGI